MVLSADPEGTQSAAIGDTLIIDFAYPSSGRFVFESRSKDCKTHIPMPPTDITRFFSTQNQGINNLTFRYADWCGGKKQISSLYLVNIENSPSPTPTPFPSPSPSPSPSPTPLPFLELPWDYQSEGLSFDDIILNPTSWLDHKYPLQNLACCVLDIINYLGQQKSLFYKSHNGYDYGAQNGVFLNTKILASASGQATFVSEANSSGAGNVIKIDHGNGYQTWYEHLQKDGLVVSVEGQKVSVNKGEVIGKVGMTGNTSGPHIHFSVFKDINGNGNFDDDFPLGVMDPLGWEGNYSDPWPADKNGARSYNLFTARSAPASSVIPTAGGTLESGNAEIVVPQGSFNNIFNLVLNNGPFETISDLVKSISPSFFLNAYTESGVSITQFSQPVKIIYDYSGSDLTNIKEETLKLYYFNEQNTSWNAIPTILDLLNNTVSGETLHFTQFALMGEVKDIIAPTTKVNIIGDKGLDNWYRSNTSVGLIGEDNEDGIGLQYTLYTLNGSDWFEYKEPIIFENEGSHKVTYQSFDKADNKEERKTVEFYIDKTAPEAKIYLDSQLQDLEVIGLDNNTTTITQTNEQDNKEEIVVTDLAGNTLKLDVRDLDKSKDKFRIYSLSYNDNLPVELDKNLYKAIYEEYNGQKLAKEENFSKNGIMLIRILYDPDKNESTIITKVNGQEKAKEKLPGQTLLQLETNRGNLGYSYQ